MATRPQYPVAVPKLIGRDEALAQVLDACQHERIVTLCGPAGVGKTVVAEHVATTRDDACICDLSDARGIDGAFSLLATTLGARLTDAQTPGDARVRLQASLKAQDIGLVVLDNCEHLRGDLQRVIDATLAVEGITLLVTSREPLFIEGERRIQIEQLSPEDAIALLVERGREVVPDFSLDAENEACAKRVVEKLDRLPFAIELFASRLDVLSLLELEKRLQSPASVLKAPGGTRARHADVAAAIVCSWNLLTDDEKRVLLQMSAFKGGATFAALELALQSSAYVGNLLDDLSSLNRKYLAYTTRMPGVDVRYHLLETVRVFLAQEIEEQELYEDLVVAHARALLDESLPHAQKTAAGDRALDREAENLAAIVRRCPPFAPEAVASAAMLLSHHRALHGPLHAHLDALDQGIAACAKIDPKQRPKKAAVVDTSPQAIARLRARLLRARGDVLRKMGRIRAADEDLEKALAEGAAANDPGLVSAIESSRAMAALLGGRSDEGVDLIQKAIAIATEAGDNRALGGALQRGGAIYLIRGNHPLVEEMCMRALSALEDREDHRGKTNAYTYLGIGRLDRGQHAATREAFTQARALYEQSDDAWSISVCDTYLGLVDLDETVGAAIAGAALDVESLAASRERLSNAHRSAEFVGHARLAAFADAMCGVCAHFEGDLAEAERRCRRAVAKGMQLSDFLAVVIGAAHLAAVLADKGVREEATHWLKTAEDRAPLLPNPASRAGLIAIDGLLAFHNGDTTRATERLAAAAGATHSVHLRLARALLAKALDVTETPSGERTAGLRVQSDGRKMGLPTGEEVDLSRRGPLRRILLALAKAHQRGEAIDVNATVEAGWPGETLTADSGTARVYTAIRTLRRLGLEGWLLTRDDGYTLREDLAVTLVESDGDSFSKPR